MSHSSDRNLLHRVYLRRDGMMVCYAPGIKLNFAAAKMPDCWFLTVSEDDDFIKLRLDPYENI